MHITYRGKVLLGSCSHQRGHDQIHIKDKRVSWNMTFGWSLAVTKYNSKTKAFVSTSSMLFVLAGYGGSLYESWMNGVWGWSEAEVKLPPCTYTPSLRTKDLLWWRGLTEEVKMRLRWSLQSSFPCKHSRAAVTSAASLDSCFTAWL